MIVCVFQTMMKLEAVEPLPQRMWRAARADSRKVHPPGRKSRTGRLIARARNGRLVGGKTEGEEKGQWRDGASSAVRRAVAGRGRRTGRAAPKRARRKSFFRWSSLRGETRTSSAASLVASWPRAMTVAARSRRVRGEALGRRGKGKGEGLILEANFGHGH